MLSSHSFSQQKHAAGSAEIRGYEKMQAGTFPTPALFKGGEPRAGSLKQLLEIALPGCHHPVHCCGQTLPSPGLAQGILNTEKGRHQTPCGEG